jgi:Ca2+-binding EF-hand superfamily protein
VKIILFKKISRVWCFFFQAEEEPEFQLTEDQVSEIRDAFNNYDKEKKGEIPTAILGTVMKNLGHNLKPDQLAECIDAVDGDGMLLKFFFSNNIMISFIFCCCCL